MRKSYAERTKERMRRIRKAAILVFLLAFLSFLASTLFGEKGILVNMQVRAEYQRLKQERDRLEQENQRLREEILAVKGNNRKIEALARTDLGLGRPGEIIFYFPPDPKQAIQKVSHPTANAPAARPMGQNAEGAGSF